MPAVNTNESISEFLTTNRNYFEDFVARSTYHSNAIEGSTLSYAETYAILFNDETLPIKASSREIYEAINHKYAINLVLDNLKLELTEQLIKNIGITINKNINEIDGYRHTQVFIRGAQHVPPSPEQVPILMGQFVYNYNHVNEKDIFARVARSHLEFESIHPFEDGNGRTGRLLINYELLKNNVSPVVVPVESRTDYFELLASGRVDELAQYLEELSRRELEQMQKFKT